MLLFWSDLILYDILYDAPGQNIRLSVIIFESLLCCYFSPDQ